MSEFAGRLMTVEEISYRDQRKANVRRLQSALHGAVAFPLKVAHKQLGIEVRGLSLDFRPEAVQQRREERLAHLAKTHGMNLRSAPKEEARDEDLCGGDAEAEARIG